MSKKVVKGSPTRNWNFIPSQIQRLLGLCKARWISAKTSKVTLNATLLRGKLKYGNGKQALWQNTSMKWSMFHCYVLIVFGSDAVLTVIWRIPQSRPLKRIPFLSSLDSNVLQDKKSEWWHIGNQGQYIPVWSFSICSSVQSFCFPPKHSLQKTHGDLRLALFSWEIHCTSTASGKWGCLPDEDVSFTISGHILLNHDFLG